MPADASPHPAPGPDHAVPEHPEVEVRRSARRRRTVSAHWSGERIILQVPAGISARELRRWEQELVAKLVARRRRTTAAASERDEDRHLMERARRISRAHLQDRAQPAEVVWSSRQSTRWGSATPATGRIRISDRLRSAPGWVLDAVLHHELCHLLEAGHGPAFRSLESRHPEMARAQAFLDGAAWALEQKDQRPLPEPESGSESGSGSDPASRCGP